MADRVTQAEKDLVRQYLQVYTDRLSNQLASAPDEIREDVVTELLNWSSSGITIDQIEAVEGSLPIKLPPILVAYLQSGFQSGVAQHGYYLPGLPSTDGTNGILNYVNSQELWPIGYLQIASNASGDPICLDFLRPTEDGDFPVVVINHDMVPAQAWESRCVMEDWAEQILPSFHLFLEFLCLGPAASNVEDIDGWQLWLEPVTQLTFEQLNYLREILARFGTGNKPENVLQVRERYCTGKRHLLLDNIWAGNYKEMSLHLRKLQIPHTFC